MAKKKERKKPEEKLKTGPKHNYTFDDNKWRDFIDLIKRDVTRESACAFLQIPQSTLTHWLNTSEKLSSEYEHAKQWMDISTSNVISTFINSKDELLKDRSEMAMKWKKVRDARYKDKMESTGETTQKIIIEKA